MSDIQNDLMSIHAERMLETWRPVIPDSLAGRLLKRWDLRYDINSRGATLFEAAYHEILRQVCGEPLFGADAWGALVGETAILADYYHLFDEVLLSDDPYWWGRAGRETRLRGILSEMLEKLDPYNVMPWGRRRRVEMTNIFFDGRLPRWVGFDCGPIELPGGRATIVQGGLFTAHGRSTTFAPSWRFITDMGTDLVYTALAGGPSGKRFSRWYTTDVRRWLEGRYKRTDIRSGE
jgi:penicillin amidase